VSNPVIVLDRDGTIIVDRHYLADPESLQFAAGAQAGLRTMADLGFRLVVITNQSGIARGFLSLATLEQIHERLRQMLKGAGVTLEGIYFCPHEPADECDCRKPKLGLMRQAAKELGFEMSKAIVIGDKDSDIEFGRRAGALTFRIGKPESRPASSAKPDYVVEGLLEAAEIIGSRSA
jgi:D-glycero-D-manno-heptose 1,7-bisphosphate phosphatase